MDRDPTRSKPSVRNSRENGAAYPDLTHQDGSGRPGPEPAFHSKHCILPDDRQTPTSIQTKAAICTMAARAMTVASNRKESITALFVENPTAQGNGEVDDQVVDPKTLGQGQFPATSAAGSNSAPSRSRTSPSVRPSVAGCSSGTRHRAPSYLTTGPTRRIPGSFRAIARAMNTGIADQRRLGDHQVGIEDREPTDLMHREGRDNSGEEEDGAVCRDGCGQ